MELQHLAHRPYTIPVITVQVRVDMIAALTDLHHQGHITTMDGMITTFEMNTTARTAIETHIVLQVIEAAIVNQMTALVAEVTNLKIILLGNPVDTLPENNRQITIREEAEMQNRRHRVRNYPLTWCKTSSRY
jgi:hypothetical protein